jgi:transposase
MNSTDLLSKALNLVLPWELKIIELSPSSDGSLQLNLTIGTISGAKFKDTEGNECSIYDSNMREWRHLNFFQHKCYIRCNVPRIREKSTGKIKQIDVPWARENSGFTLLFEAYVMQLIEFEMPISKVGSLVNEYPNRIWTIFHYWISKSYNLANHSTINQIGIDETSTKKGHNYVTIGVDLATHSVFNGSIKYCGD